MGLLERIRSGRFVPDDGPALASPGITLTLHEAGARLQQGAGVLSVVRDFLDQAGRAEPAQLSIMISERPRLTGDARADALIAAVGEHLAVERGIPCPIWTAEPERFLDHFWFVSTEPGFRAIALAQAPPALKRRGILWPSASLRRV
jgi:hypothetical protein